jgi:CubicO group peptidase (beta-lactamase class C family)
MKKLILIILLFCVTYVKSQTLYFPQLTGTTWDTTSPASLGWCQESIDTLYNYLQARNTVAFIVLKNGKIVLEKYFGTFTSDSIHIWNSAGKSFTSVLTGIAQENGLFNISDTVSNILGNGWTSCTTNQERQITIHNLITMTSGLNDAPTGGCTNLDVTPTCLQYLTTPNARWAYHTGAYRKTEDVISTAAGVTYNNFAHTKVCNTIGMQGVWFNYEFYSRTRDAARFGLLILNKAIWNSDTLLHDTAYFHAMTNTSQNYNLSYGYLWWLNGKNSFMSPGLQTVFPNSLVSNAPADMFAALGKNDQKIYIAPSTGMIVVRFGNSAYGVADAFSPFDNELWGYINTLSCTPLGINEAKSSSEITIYPNPFINKISLSNTTGLEEFELTNTLGQTVWSGKYIEQKDFSDLYMGVYFLKIKTSRSIQIVKLMKQ